MANTQSFQCPNCGSPILTSGAEKEVRCAYCGSTVIVPEELRDRTPIAPINYDQAIHTEDEIVKTIGTVGKVTAGVTVGVTAMSVILPIALTCIILGVVGFIMYSVFSTNKSSVVINNLPTQAAVVFTQVPTDTPPPSATPFDTPAPFNKVLLQDNFTNSSSGWEKSRNSNYVLEYKEGNYHVLINKQDGGQIVYLGKTYGDASIEVGIQQTAGPADGRYGIACRVTDAGTLYSFEFGQDGSYGIYKYTDWNSDTLDEGTLDPNTIVQGSVNHLEGICDGETLTLLLNSQPVLQVQDSEYTSGGVGLIARTGDSGQAGIDLLFSDFLVKGP